MVDQRFLMAKGIILLICYSSVSAIGVVKVAKSLLPTKADISRKLESVVPDSIPVISEAENETQACYDNLGCFGLGSPWKTLTRPLPSPWSPEKISPSVVLYTKKQKEGFNQSLEAEEFTISGSDFDPKRPMTVVMTHGFASSGKSDWILEMKDAYLQNVDANVFVLDWERGASLINYLQVASNTRIVGAQLARFIRYLIDQGQSTKKLHLIGHSLGSHIMSYCAKNVSEISEINRITALDPAQPAFEGNDEKVRLDSKDAENVDVIHTDAKPFIPFLGFGMIVPVGTVDFYMNGGSMQPGCLSLPTPNITSLIDLAEYPVEVVSEWVSCSHGRSYLYFTEALKNKTCSFWGRKMSSTENFLKLGTLGRLSLADPVVDALSSCTAETCNRIGLDTFKLPSRGSFAVTTNREAPFCETPLKDEGTLKNLYSTVVDSYFEPVMSLGKKVSSLKSKFVNTVAYYLGK